MKENIEMENIEMENINIKMTDSSPKVKLDYEKAFIEFEGKSFPENTFDFYEPIVQWIKNYFTEYERKTTTINIKLTYFNSASTQILFDIFDAIQDNKTNEVIINWYYALDNENGLDDYEDYSEEFEELNINAVAYAEEV